MPKVLYDKKMKVTNKAARILNEAFYIRNVDPYKPFDLYKITSYIQDQYRPYEYENCRLNTTLEILKAIEYMKDNNMFYKE